MGMSKKAEFFELLDELLVEVEVLVDDKRVENNEFQAKIDQLRDFMAIVKPVDEEPKVEANIVRTDAID